jgi:hypothetical protein
MSLALEFKTHEISLCVRDDRTKWNFDMKQEEKASNLFKVVLELRIFLAMQQHRPDQPFFGIIKKMG